MYNRVFWLAYAANTTLMVCVSILFRYANFVQLRVGPDFEFMLGLIVGVGMVGALAMRVVLGVAIDRYGSGRVWMLSLGLVILSLLLHFAITSEEIFHIALVYVARIILMVGLAGAFGASLTFISLRAPHGRMGELVGVLGTSGFLGLATGPIIGDWLFSHGGITAANVQGMFLTAAAAACVSLVLTYFTTAGSTPLARAVKRRPPMLWLLRRYHPGAILICAAAMGCSVMLPHTFLQPYAEQLNIPRIRTFFLVYATGAFVVRLLTRHFTDRHGVRLTAQLGFGSMALCLLSFMFVTNEWLLAVPALLGGVAHAMLFPAIVTGGNISFPARYRGLATTLVLAMFDVGNLVGQPTIGAVVEYAPTFGLPGYTTMFASMAGVMIAAAVAACWIREPRDMQVEVDPPTITEEEIHEERELVETCRTDC